MLAELDAWSRRHALVVLAACAISLWAGSAAWLAGALGISIAFLVFRARRRWTPDGRFGAANGVTALRLALVVSLPAWPASTPGVALGALALGVFALDGLDGWLAARLGAASEFGAHFDMEADAAFVLAVELVLFLRGDAGAWILITGLLRYFYVLTLGLFPPRGHAARRSRYGRYAFSCLAVGLIGAFALPHPWGTALAVLGTAAVSASFASSFYAAYRPGPADAQEPGARRP